MQSISDTFPAGTIAPLALDAAEPMSLSRLLWARIEEYQPVLDHPDPSVQRAGLGALQHELRRLVRGTERQQEVAHAPQHLDP